MVLHVIFKRILLYDQISICAAEDLDLKVTWESIVLISRRFTILFAQPIFMNNAVFNKGCMVIRGLLVALRAIG